MSLLASFLLALAVLLVICVLVLPSALADTPGATRNALALEVDADALLDSIAAVETGRNPAAIGPVGERGRCQFTLATWRCYTRADFRSWASVDCPFTRSIERLHLEWLRRQLVRQGYPHPEPELLAAAWRHGPAYAAQALRTDYVRRVAALYRSAGRARADLAAAELEGAAR